MRGKYSPTVHWAYQRDQEWHARAREKSGDPNRDPEGFDQYGYNVMGEDRAGNTEWDYMTSYDPEDPDNDPGQNLYDQVLHDYFNVNLETRFN
jgi:hypothetical protein